MEKSGYVPSGDSQMRNDRMKVLTLYSSEIRMAVDRCPVFSDLQPLKNDGHGLSVSTESGRSRGVSCLKGFKASESRMHYI